MRVDIVQDADQAIDWMCTYMVKRKSLNRKHTTYGLKHLLQAQTGIYLTCESFNECMCRLGHAPHNSNDLPQRWQWCISEKAIKQSWKDYDERREKMPQPPKEEGE